MRNSPTFTGREGIQNNTSFSIRTREAGNSLFENRSTDAESDSRIGSPMTRTPLKKMPGSASSVSAAASLNQWQALPPIETKTRPDPEALQEPISDQNESPSKRLTSLQKEVTPTIQDSQTALQIVSIDKSPTKSHVIGGLDARIESPGLYQTYKALRMRMASMQKKPAPAVPPGGGDTQREDSSGDSTKASSKKTDGIKGLKKEDGHIDLVALEKTKGTEVGQAYFEAEKDKVNLSAEKTKPLKSEDVNKMAEQDQKHTAEVTNKNKTDLDLTALSENTGKNKNTSDGGQNEVKNKNAVLSAPREKEEEKTKKRKSKFDPAVLEEVKKRVSALDPVMRKVYLGTCPFHLLPPLAKKVVRIFVSSTFSGNVQVMVMRPFQSAHPLLISCQVVLPRLTHMT